MITSKGIDVVVTCTGTADTTGIGGIPSARIVVDVSVVIFAAATAHLSITGGVTRVASLCSGTNRRRVNARPYGENTPLPRVS